MIMPFSPVFPNIWKENDTNSNRKFFFGFAFSEVVDISSTNIFNWNILELVLFFLPIFVNSPYCFLFSRKSCVKKGIFNINCRHLIGIHYKL